MITVLETVAQSGPISAAEVARACEINRTVAHRLLATLAQRAYVQKDEAGYIVGPALRQLASTPQVDLVEIAKPVMQSLAESTGETVVLHSLAGTEAMVVEQVTGKRHVLTVNHRPGSRYPLNKGAGGWAILAFQNSRAIKRLLAKTEDPEAGMVRIAQVKSEGVAFSHDELQAGISGIAAPVTGADGTCRASLTLLTPNVRGNLLKDFVPELLGSAEAISRQLR